MTEFTERQYAYAWKAIQRCEAIIAQAMRTIELNKQIITEIESQHPEALDRYKDHGTQYGLD